ncbi:hypothetical protein PR048_011748 [Dryococelus australis]|uniref:HAT C-terminal dimerisation domain-containing protein n=1 Tax=Dryococelus australis TaxID=614101 RepID=A0ABQ9HMZ1_9NEOP|nr:hypothetical protein PR048_011748 [Dryococelus australis]
MAELASAQTSIKKLQDSEWALLEGHVEYPTSSCVIPLLDGITETLKIFLCQGNSKRKKSRFPDVRNQKTYLFAMVLDPQFKCVLRLQGVTNTLHSNDSEQSVDTSSDEQEESSVWDSLRRAAKNVQKENLALYKKKEPIIRKVHGRQPTKRNFQDVQLSQCQYLSVPASQVSSEIMFSAAGNIVTMRRECLNPDTI